MKENCFLTLNDIRTCEKIEVGVPQGSALGLLLFLILIIDLQNNLISLLNKRRKKKLKLPRNFLF